jgi:hypothetical protein
LTVLLVSIFLEGIKFVRHGFAGATGELVLAFAF